MMDENFTDKKGRCKSVNQKATLFTWGKKHTKNQKVFRNNGL